MAPHNTAELEEPMALLTTDSGLDVDDVTDEEMKKWLSTAFEHDSANPMKEPLTAPLDLPISDTDVEKIKVGFKSQSMDDKWNFLIEDPDENGNISLHIIRYWLGSGEDCYVLHIVPNPSDDNGGSARVQGITWEGNKAGLQCDAEQAKKEAVMLCRVILNCEFEVLPHYPNSMFWDSNAYKKLNVK